MPPEVRKWIVDERARLNAEDNTSSSGKDTRTALDTKVTIPNQYTKAHEMTTEDAHTAVRAFLSQNDEEGSESSDELISHAGTTVAFVGISNQQVSKVMNVLSLDQGFHLSISDNGADTSVIGKSWEIIATHPTQQAHVYISKLIAFEFKGTTGKF